MGIKQLARKYPNCWTSLWGVWYIREKGSLSGDYSQLASISFIQASSQSFWVEIVIDWWQWNFAPQMIYPMGQTSFFPCKCEKGTFFFLESSPSSPSIFTLIFKKKTSLIMFCHYWVTSIAHHFLPFLLYTTPPLHHHGKGMKPANMVPEAIEMMARVKLRMGPVSENAPTAAENSSSRSFMAWKWPMGSTTLKMVILWDFNRDWVGKSWESGRITRPGRHTKNYG